MNKGKEITRIGAAVNQHQRDMIQRIQNGVIIAINPNILPKTQFAQPGIKFVTNAVSKVIFRRIVATSKRTMAERIKAKHFKCQRITEEQIVTGMDLLLIGLRKRMWKKLI